MKERTDYRRKLGARSLDVTRASGVLWDVFSPEEVTVKHNKHYCMKNILFFLMACALLLSSCVRKDLILEGTAAHVTVDVEEVLPIVGRVSAGSMFRGVVFGGPTEATFFVPREGGIVDIAAGDLRIVLHSFGSEACIVEEDAAGVVSVSTNVSDLYSDRWYAAAMASDTLVGVAEAARLAGISVRWEPDAMFAGIEEVHLRHRAVEDTLYLPMKATPAFEVRRLRLTAVGGLDYASVAEGWVAGAAASRSLEDGTLSGTAAIPVTLYRDGNDLVGQWRTFGEAPGDVWFIADITDRAGVHHMQAYRLDGTFAQGWSAAMPGELDIPEVDAPASGLEPVLEDWNDVMIPVEL